MSVPVSADGSGSGGAGGVGHVLTEEEIEDIRESFDLFDTNRRGSLDLHAFTVALKAMGFELDKHQAAAEVEAVLEASPGGRTFNGRVDYDAFLEVVRLLTTRRDPVTHFMKAFDLFDCDSTGKISVANVQAVSAKLGERLSNSEIKAMIDEFDRDQDGFISRSEFLYIMQQLH